MPSKPTWATLMVLAPVCAQLAGAFHLTGAFKLAQGTAYSSGSTTGGFCLFVPLICNERPGWVLAICGYASDRPREGTSLAL